MARAEEPYYRMNKILAIAVLLLFMQSAIAQKGIDDLIQAEKNFAAYSVANNTKDAFLRFADSAGIVFDKGKPVNAIEIWTTREKRPGKLNWWPVYAEIASSGDFGYTTGPWDFSINDTVKANGYYVTAWHINKNGEWKFLIDLGVGDTHCDVAALKTNALKNDSQIKGTKVDLRQAEENMIAGYQQNGKISYPNFLSDNSRLYRNGRCVADQPEQRYLALDSLPSKIQYTINGTGIASTGDMGYVYGTTVINGKTDNYLRIWQKEKSGWKISVEVLRY